MGHGVRYLRKWLLLGILIGIVAGLGAIVFQKAIVWVTSLALGHAAGFLPPQPLGEGQDTVVSPLRRWAIPLITAAGGLISGLLVFKLAPEAEGHGTDAAIEAYHHKDGIIRWRIPYIKLVASAITIGSGGSGGREGPTALIGAGFGSFLGQVLHISPSDRRIAVAAGIGAGIGAIFKAPLGGGILAAEVLYLQGLEAEALVPAFISTMVAYSVYAGVVGFTPVFGTGIDVTFNDPVSLLFYALLGIVCGAMGIVYSRTFYGMRALFHRWGIPPWIKPAVGGLLTGLIALALPQVLGMGYGWVQLAMVPNGLQLGLGLIAILVLAKIVATSFSIGSGGSGGVFAPGIVIGGLLGATMWQALHSVSHMPATSASFVIVGMMAFFGAVGHAPLAVMVMVAEMTGTYTLLPPAMVAVGLASVVVGNNTIYRSQVPSPADSPAHRGEYSFPLLHSLRVREAMKTEVATITPETTVEKAESMMQKQEIKGLPVVDGEGRLVGIVAKIDVIQVPHDRWATTSVREIMSTHMVVTHADDRLDNAMDLMQQHHIGRLPVVDDDAPSRIVGIITTSDVVDTYHRAAEQGRRS